MKKLSALTLCFIAVGFLSAQENPKGIRESLGIKKYLVAQDLEPYPIYAETSATSGDKARILPLTTYVTDDYGEIMHCLDLSTTETISFWVDFTAVYKTDVKFHFIWTGPEFYYYETEWYEVRYNEYYYFSVDTNNAWRKGTYKLTIIAEQGNTGSGAQSVLECNFRFY